MRFDTRHFLPGFACLLLAACGNNQQAARTAAAACQPTLEATVPIRMVRNAVLVPARIDRQPVQLQVDTGSQVTSMTPDAVRRLGLKPDTHHQTSLRGAGGTAETTRNSLVRAVELAGVQWSDNSLPTANLPTSFAETPPVAGILGADLLSVFDVELDVPHGRMLLWSVHRCEGDFVPWHELHFRFPLTPRGNKLLAATVEIDRHPVHALIDWGAQVSELKTEIAEDAGITPESLLHDRAGSAKGVDEREIASHRHQIAELRIGAETIHNGFVSVGAIQTDLVDMLLGMDYFRGRHVWLSYTTRQMFVEIRRPIQPAP